MVGGGVLLASGAERLEKLLEHPATSNDLSQASGTKIEKPWLGLSQLGFGDCPVQAFQTMFHREKEK